MMRRPLLCLLLPLALAGCATLADITPDVLFD